MKRETTRLTRQSPPDDDLSRQCDAIVEEPDGQPNQCTIYSTASGDPVSTTWISASAGSYRSLEECR